ncbi:ABC transporter permease [Chitinophaga sp. sic0106]|uniref:ABC transporter permease n=1 Tax=Chitinophaga sp. sic0106 TaxID=2854785 RepID=UPI001C4381A0|nr:ABC transporter permease [Chitinophaga sp. sic0106]MBV7532352.1 ABC transporter permease [Chitinophaga sp. sic0106]
MIRNYLKIALRNLWKNKAFSAINITGLAIGIATCLVISLYISYELSYDQFNKNSDRIVRVVLRGQVKGEPMKEANVFPPLAAVLKSTFPEIEETVRLRNAGVPTIVYNDKKYQEYMVGYADPSLFNIFDFTLLDGNKAQALTEPFTIILSDRMATKYFGKADPMGKMLFFKDENQYYRVTGVYKEQPANTHMRFDMIASMSSVPDSRSESWLTSGYFTYLLLPKGYDRSKLEAKLPSLVEKYVGPQMQQYMHMSLSEFKAVGNKFDLRLQKLTDIHLHSDYGYDLDTPGDIRYIYIFGAIVLFMILIACINFMNLSTANAVGRVKEVAMRKVLGAARGRLVIQFMLESIALTLIATIIAVLLAFLLLPTFNKLAGRNIELHWLSTPWLVPIILLFAVITGMVAGSYPAFFLASFKPEAALKRSFSPGGKQGTRIRSSLVVFQFFVSITLMVSTAIVYNQLSYIQHKKLGYNKDNVLLLHQTDRISGSQREAMRSKLLQDSRVKGITVSAYLPSGPSYSNNYFIYEKTSDAQIKTLRYEVDENYLDVMGMQLTAGRNFSAKFGGDTSSAVINEATAKAMGWGNDAIGKTFRHMDIRSAGKTFQVIGVVKDFHFKSMHTPISPLVMELSNGWGPMFIIKHDPAHTEALVASLEQQWKAFNTDVSFYYTFLDQHYADSYQSEANTGRILAIFAGLTIFVACLGVFGLATYTARKRAKEISVRKVMGASVSGIVTLLSTDFLKLVLLAFLLSVPVAWYLMRQWLQGFAYSVDIHWWIFAATAAGAIIITLLTVSLQAVKAALANPIKSLRSE